MSVLVDTPVWSLALRRQTGDLNLREQALTETLRGLIRDGRAQMMGAIRQELLSGLREAERFEKMRAYLRAFPEPPLEIDDYEEGARAHNQCRARGVAGSAVDFLVCAVAGRRNWQILTTDRDFERYARVLGVKLYVTVGGS